MKGKRTSRILIFLSSILMTLPAALAIWTAEAETLAHYTPTCARADLLPILRKEQPDEADYAVLFQQTGLAKAGVDELYTSGQQWKLLGLQERYLAEAEVECDCGDFFIRSERLTNFSELIYDTERARMWESAVGNVECKISPDGMTVEAQGDSAGNAAGLYGSGRAGGDSEASDKDTAYLEATARGAMSEASAAFYFLPTVQTGDILITFSGHIFGWRSGHAAIVVDAENHLTLEAIMPGYDSAVCTLDDWQEYPGFALLRLKDVSKEEREQIAAYAREHLTGLPYRLTAFTGAGVDGEMTTCALDEETGMSGTQCAHLVWYAYMHFGYDLDSDGGFVVTPEDLYRSDLLELVQIYGLDPNS